jgi:hypothetical protein
MSGNEMKRVNVRITPEVHEWFRIRSDKTGVPASSLMFLALEQYIQQQTMLPHIPEILEKARQQQ